MLLCVTPNPILDRTLIVPSFAPGRDYRPEEIEVSAGGKGLNVARAALTLGAQVRSFALLGGYTGKLIESLAQAEGLNGVWHWHDQETRIGTIIIDPNTGTTTGVYERGKPVPVDVFVRFLDTILELAAQPAITQVCISGSLPTGAAPEFFARALELLVAGGKPVWVDTSGSALKAAFSVHGAHIKVNHLEAQALLGYELDTPEKYAQASAALHDMTGATVVVTGGAWGGVIRRADDPSVCWYAQPPTVQVKSAVGSGDSASAALAVFAHLPADQQIRRAIAAGTANAATLSVGCFELEDFERIVEQTTVTRIK